MKTVGPREITCECRAKPSAMGNIPLHQLHPARDHSGRRPTLPCNAGTATSKQVVSYPADYIFWKPV